MDGSGVRGRPATGKGSVAISLRLPVEVLAILQQRGQKVGWSDVTQYIQWYLEHDAMRNRHPGRTYGTPGQ